MKSRLRLRAFALALSTLAMTMSLVAGAQAEVRVNGAKLTTEKEVTGEAHQLTNFLVPAKNIELLCSTHIIDEGIILANDEGHGAILLTGCKFFLSGIESKGCKPKEPLLATGHGKLFLYESATHILVDPPGSEPYARVDFPAATCALPDTSIRGTAVAECLTPALQRVASDCETERTQHLVQQVAAPEHGLFYGVNAAFFDGIAEVELVSGETFSGVV